MPAMQYWLFKTEPSEFGIEDLIGSPNQATSWTGIRNYMARNLLRDKVQVGDRVFIYHSSIVDKGIAGIAEIVRAAYPDPTALDKSSDYFDPKSSADKPVWCAVDVRLITAFAEIVLLARLKQTKGLEKMMVCQRGARLSIQPVSLPEWNIICRIAEMSG